MDVNLLVSVYSDIIEVIIYNQTELEARGRGTSFRTSFRITFFKIYWACETFLHLVNIFSTYFA